MKQKSLTLQEGPLKTLRVYRITIETIAIILLTVWLYTGTSKLMEYYNFRYQIRQIPYLADFAPFLTFFVPILEIVLAVMLIVRKTQLPGLIASAGLMLVFTVHVLYVVTYMSDKPCGCGGIISSLSWNQHLTLNIVLTLLALIGTILKIRLNKWSRAKA